MNEVEAKKSAKPAPFTDEELLKLPLVLNSEQTARILGCSRSKLQSMCRADAIEFQRFQNRFTFNRDYVFKLAGISYESLYKTVSERCLAREKVKEQYAPPLQEIRRGHLRRGAPSGRSIDRQRR